MAADRPTLEDLLDDPTASQPLKAVILAWRVRDSVDAANDAAVLAELMADRAAFALEQRDGP